MKLSIVTTLYQSAIYLEDYCYRITNSVLQITNDYEIIFVNDGSPDSSLQTALELQKKYSNIVVVSLSRNFGHHNAIMTGLEYASGDYVFLIDADLEDPPELLNDFWKILQSNQHDVVYGYQVSRKGNFIERTTGALFWKLMNWASDIKVTPNPCTVRLMEKKYVDSLLLYGEKELYLAGVFAHVGFDQVGIPVNKISSASTTYSLSNKVKLFVNALTSFSSAPLTAVFYLGVFTFLSSSVFVIYLLVRKFLNPDTVLIGWSSLLASIWMIGGGGIMSFGLTGIYLGKIFSEVKNRPLTIVRKVYKNNEAEIDEQTK